MNRDKYAILYKMISRQRQYHDAKANFQDERILHLEQCLVRIISTLSDQIDIIETKINQLEARLDDFADRLNDLGNDSKQ